MITKNINIKLLTYDELTNEEKEFIFNEFEDDFYRYVGDCNESLIEELEDSVNAIMEDLYMVNHSGYRVRVTAADFKERYLQDFKLSKQENMTELEYAKRFIKQLLKYIDKSEKCNYTGVDYDYILSDTIKEFFEDCKKSLGRYGTEEHFIDVFNSNIQKCFDDMDENYYNEEVKECYFDNLQYDGNYFYKINGILQKNLIDLNTLKVGA